MNRHFNDKAPRPNRKYSKKRSDFEKLPLKVQLQTIMSKFDDPLTEVLSILDPFHDKIVRPEVKSNMSVPSDPNYGLFRVIFWTGDDDGTKFHTMVTEAVDGRDAAEKINVEFIDLHKMNLMKVVGVECVAVPKKYIWKINEEFPIHEQIGIIKTQAELEKAHIVSRLEVFEDIKATADLTPFLLGDQTNIDK